MNWTERRERFRALLSGQRCVHPGSVYEPADRVRIAEDSGFEVGMFSGSVGSMAVLGAPDLVVLTLSEFAAQANRICRAGNLALLVDADHGYGNALNVRRTVEELETAGICAMSIEDTVLPRPYGPEGKPPPELGRGGCRQDEGGVVGAPGQEPGHRRAHQRARQLPMSTRRSSGPGPTRRPGSTRSSSPAGDCRGSRGGVGGNQGPADPRRRQRPARRSRLAGRASGAGALQTHAPFSPRAGGLHR